jgi:hypothetical protein
MIFYRAGLYVAHLANGRMGHGCAFSLFVRLSFFQVSFGGRGVQKIKEGNGKTQTRCSLNLLSV